MGMTVAERHMELRALMQRLRVAVADVPTDPCAESKAAHMDLVHNAVTMLPHVFELCRAVGATLELDDALLIKRNVDGQVLVDLTEVSIGDIVIAQARHVEMAEAVRRAMSIALRAMMIELQLGVHDASDVVFRAIKDYWLSKTAGNRSNDPGLVSVLKQHYPGHSLLFS